ncbi:hypothetical protein [Streptacidiphilus sp. PAMC 29251]
MPDLPDPTVRPSRYTVTCLPEGFFEAWRWDVTVEQQQDGRWVIEHCGMFLTVHEDRLWSESKADAARITGSGLARSIAKQHAPLVRADGRTVAEALRLAAEWKEQDRG